MFDFFGEELPLDLPQSTIHYFPNFIDTHAADAYFKTFRATVPWQQDRIKVFGKEYLQPRLTSLYSTNGKPYSYANITMHPHPFSKELLALKTKVEKVSNTHFTTCLLNLYRDGKDSNGWHADNEKELGIHPIIASVTLGQERYFHLKHRTHKNWKHKLLLKHGSLLIMKGETQEYWLHQVPKTAKPVKERINLTFRIIN